MIEPPPCVLPPRADPVRRGRSPQLGTVERSTISAATSASTSPFHRAPSAREARPPSTGTTYGFSTAVPRIGSCHAFCSAPRDVGCDQLASQSVALRGNATASRHTGMRFVLVSAWPTVFRCACVAGVAVQNGQRHPASWSHPTGQPAPSPDPDHNTVTVSALFWSVRRRAGRRSYRSVSREPLSSRPSISATATRSSRKAPI